LIKNTHDVIGKDYQYTIVGTGPAGITLAINLAKENKKVLLIEAGGWEFSEKSQKEYEGKVIGDSQYNIKLSRLRFFGGSSGHWGGMCRPLDTIDFSHFPIEKKDLNSYLKRSCDILEIPGRFNRDRRISKDFKQIEFQYSPPVRFNKKYRAYIEESKNIDLVLNTSVLEIVESKKSNSAEFLKVVDNSNNFFNISVNKLIIACGGIENSRLLLWSQHINKKLFSGLTIGEYWMEHPHHMTGSFIMLNSVFDTIFDHSFKGKRGYVYIQPTDAVINNNNIGNAGIRIKYGKLPRNNLKDLVREVLCVNEEYGRELAELLDQNLVCGSKVKAAWEQKPVKENKVELDFNNKDNYGIPRVKLSWRVNNDDLRTALVFMKKLGILFIDKDIGTVGVNLRLKDEETEQNGYGCCTTGGHHMGGTRMGDSSKNSVVDKNLKVFGVDNTWVLGSSVFSGGGHANPTLTVIQLSLRLASHLDNTKNKINL
jgi:choline dehydrogenase-like flavoprotein